MKTLKQLKKEIETTQTIKSVVQTYEEISVLKMQKIRDSVLTTRDFLKRILEIYEEVRYSYKEVIEELITKLNKGKSGKFTFSTITKNGKKLTILMTSNEGLSGDISTKVFGEFLDNVNYNENDLIIVGRRGRNLLESYNIEKEYKYYDLPDVGVKMSDLSDLISEIVKYEEVTVFHGKLLNIVNQEGVASNITARLTEEAKGEGKKNKYLFEPSLKEVLRFFEVQIFASLFKQTVSETNLANLGSRITAMEQASKNSEDRMDALSKEKRSVSKSIDNKKQQQRLAGMSLWGS